MKILALRSPGVINDLSVAISPSLPIGLAYVVAAVKDLAEVEVIDPVAEKPRAAALTPLKNGTSILGLTPAQTVTRVRQAPDVCLVSSMFSMEWPVTRELIELLRKSYPGCVIVGGGEHFSAAAEYSLKNSPLDICVVGEGEQTIRELVTRLIAEKKLPLDVPGTAVKDPGGRIIANPRRPRIAEPGELRPPAWELFPVEKFLRNRGGGSFPILASRGCPYSCTFCSSEAMWGTRWTPRPARDVVEEMKLWLGKYGIEHYDLCDQTAIVDRNWTLELCRLLIEAKLPVTWGLPSGTRSEALDAEVLRQLKLSGCNDLDYAPESGSPRMLELIGKKIDKNKMLASIRSCHQAGINSKANIVLGFPQEGYRDVFETFRFILKLAFAGLNDLLVTSFSPYPGSKLFEELKAEGRIRLDEAYFLSLAGQGSLNAAPSFSRFGRLELFFFKMAAFSLFYILSLLLRPRRLAALLRDLAAWQGSTRLSLGIINLVNRRRGRAD